MDSFLFNTLPKRQQYAFSVATILCVATICYAFSGVISYRVTALLLLLTVSLLAITFDIMPVLLAAALSAIIWDFFFIPPKYAIHVETTEDTILLVMYFVIAMINGVLTNRMRKIQKAASIKEEKANSVKLYNTILDSLSHELRTPIAAILGATDNLQANRNLTDQDKEQLVYEISRASLRLNQQVENLLNISRLESGHIQPNNDWCDVVELVYDVVRRVEENHALRRIDISVNQDMPLCRIDKGMLDQIIYNLLNNAAIHTPTGCKIEIAITCHADLLSILIQDNGAGFKDVNLRDVFDKFSRTKELKTSGSGLGLSIVKGFTEALRGSIELVRTNEKGVRFMISIPVKTSMFKTIIQ
ncbi:PAS domain-containing sensor histidine kinase [Segetibacter sp. 3557_3]|uniref:sensor histidine kinase n=1 Tax=Segetibacter sp. 3557_3 TaxID=2547429 RepID=UPI001058CD2B|nr:DUF4118 domain-containing protein [Segetibacter sp. 3557_3]TDH20089.1 PAS domain-containing sensor histidine kinase [Segetibacter sp. 3557_3]